MKYSIYIIILLIFVLSCLPISMNAQIDNGNILKANQFTCIATVSTKGISTIPNLTLGKPAMVFDMVMGRRLTFEPQFRFSLKGKPWAMVFWWKYKVISGNKFKLDVRVNHSLSFKSLNDTTTGTLQETIRTTRYMAGAITPNMQINKYIGVGMYLFYTWGIEKYITRNTYMVSFRPSFSNIPVTRQIVARLGPEIYYLKMDTKEGIYLNGTLSITKSDFPFSLSALINKPLRSNIPSENNLLWNISLIYTFNKTFLEKK